MRRPVSTLGRKTYGLAVLGGVVQGAFTPAFPDDTGPGARKDADRVRVIAAALASSPVHISSPGRALTGVRRKAGEGFTELAIAGPAKAHSSLLTRRVGNGRYPSEGSKLFGGLESCTISAELREHHSGRNATAAGKTLQYTCIGKLAQASLDFCLERSNARDKWLEDIDQCVHAGGGSVRNVVRDNGSWRVLQAREQLGSGTSSAVRIFLEESLKPLFSKLGYGNFAGKLAQECERDRRVDIGENGGGSGENRVQERAQLVRQSDACTHEILAQTHQDPQCLDLLGMRHQRLEAMSVGSEEIGQDVGVAGIALSRRAVPRANGLDDIGVHRDDGDRGIQQRVDQHAVRPFDRNDGFLETMDSLTQLNEPVLIVCNLEALDDASSFVDDADRVKSACPVEPYKMAHRQFPCFGATIQIAGGSGGLLIDRRSTRSQTTVTQRPVAHLTLRHPRLCGDSHRGRQATSERGRHSRGPASTSAFAAPAGTMVHQ